MSTSGSSAAHGSLPRTALWLLTSGYPQEKSPAPVAVLLTFGALIVLASMVCRLAFNARKTLRRPNYIWPPKTPETVPDAWIGAGIMAAISIAMLVLVAVFGGDSWAEQTISMASLLPLALIGPGIVDGSSSAGAPRPLRLVHD